MSGDEFRVLGVIPARGGSKGLPRKNLLTLGGKTLLELAVASARRSRLITKLIVSTEDDELRAAAERAGAELPFRRPAELATDTASTWDVLRHAVGWLDAHEAWHADIVVLLQPTTPFRRPEHIDGVVDLLVDSSADSAMTIREVDYPPYWMVRLAPDGRLSSVIEGGHRYLRRQDTPPVYQPAGSVYALRRETLMTLQTLLPTPETRGFIVDAEDSVNIDEWRHFELARAIWERRERASGAVL